MSSKTQILEELKSLGSESIKRTLLRHGAVEPFFGVKVQDLKVLQKRIGHDHKLACELFKSGNSDAQYLASLVCDPAQFTKAQLDQWAKTASWHMISEYSVAWAAAESPLGWELAQEWLESDEPQIASAGWATLSFIVAITPDEQLDLKVLKKLIQGLPKALKSQANRTAYSMNGFLIAVGCYVVPLSAFAQSIATKVGVVEVDVGDTDCKVPVATAYIQKVIKAGRLGKKRKTAYC